MGSQLRVRALPVHASDPPRWLLGRVDEDGEPVDTYGRRVGADPSRPAKPLALNQLHRLLRSPYYRGVVVWQGVEHPGRHEPLVDDGTWQRVQDTLSAKRTGEKERVHKH